MRLRRCRVPHQPSRLRPRIEALEPRILFSGDPLSAAFAPNVPDLQAEVRLLEPEPAVPPPSTTVSAEQTRSHELIFIDKQVEGYQALVDDLVGSSDGTREVEIFLLDPKRDGIEQISAVLGQRSGISAVHLVSHGADGQVQLGSATLGVDTLRTQAAQIKLWGAALAADADLLIYGCDVAATADGQAFVARLGELTGADVAASTDLTGSAEQGGDWQLEYRQGAIESVMALSARLQSGWGWTLGTEQAAAQYLTTPLAFEENVGHLDAAVDFLARGSGYAVFLTEGDAVLTLGRADGTGHVVRLDVLGADAASGASGESQLDTRTNYLIGRALVHY